jgi:hypothetical protein
MFVPPVSLPHQSLGAIALHRSADTAPGHEPGLPQTFRVLENEEHEQRRSVGVAFFIDALVLVAKADAFRSGESLVGARNSLSGHAAYGVRRIRPFARRLLRTSRPFFVFIRWRKPCFFL